MKPFQRWLTALLLVILAVGVAYQWLDRPLALFFHQDLPHHARNVFAPLAHIPDPLIPAAVIVFVGLGLWALAGRPLPPLPATVVICSLSVTMTQAFKNLLKLVFGRTWPETWIDNNPSFIRDGAYGFHWFHGGGGYESFPSGHMAAACAVLAVLWIRHPRLKPLYLLAGLVVAAGLVGANFHFLSDVIAGGFVGLTTGWITAVLFDRLLSRGPGRV